MQGENFMTFPVDSSFAKSEKPKTQSFSPTRKKQLPPAINTLQNSPSSSPRKTKPVIVIHQSSENKSDEDFPSKPHHRRSPFCIFTKDGESFAPQDSMKLHPGSTFTPISSALSESPSPSPMTGIAESVEFEDSMEISSSKSDSASGHRRVKQGYFYPARSDFLEDGPLSASSQLSNPSSVCPSPCDFSSSSHSVSPNSIDSRQEMSPTIQKNTHRRVQNDRNYLFLPSDSVQPAHRRVVDGYLYTGQSDLLTDPPLSASSLSPSPSSAPPSPCDFSSSSHSVSPNSIDSRQEMSPTIQKNAHRRVQNDRNYLFLPNDSVQPAHRRVVDGNLYTGQSDLFTDRPPSVSSPSSHSPSE